MRDLGCVGARHHQAVPGERVIHRADHGPLVLRAARAQLGAGHRATDRPAVVAYRGHSPEHVPRDRLPVLRQSGVDSFGADFDGAGDAARAVVAFAGQPVAFAFLPGQHQGLGQHRQHCAARPGVGYVDIGHDGVDESAISAQPARLGRPGDRAAQASFRHRADHQLIALHGPDELRISSAPIPVIPADRDHHPGRRLARRPGRAGRRRAHRIDERRPLQPPVRSFGREDLLELVDDQHQPLRAPLRRGQHDLADQQVRLAGRVGQRLPDRGGILAGQRRQSGRQVGERSRGNGEADHRPGG